MVAASSKLMVDGFFATMRASAAMYSAKAPGFPIRPVAKL